MRVFRALLLIVFGLLTALVANDLFKAPNVNAALNWEVLAIFVFIMLVVGPFWPNADKMQRWKATLTRVTGIPNATPPERDVSVRQSMHGQPSGRLSTKYLVSLISFMAGALVTIEGFRSLFAHGLRAMTLVKVAICLSFFVTSVVVMNKNNYFKNRDQHQLLMNLQLSAPQAVLALAILAIWIAVRVIFFGAS